MTSSEVSSDIEQLRAGGERLTPQRLLVLEAVREMSGHVSADEVLEHVNRKFPAVNRTTVYRILSWLRDQRLVSVTDLGGGQLVHEYLTSERHHHLVCQACGCHLTIGDDCIAPMLVDIRERYGFEPRLDHLALFGTCRGCLETQTSESTQHIQEHS